MGSLFKRGDTWWIQYYQHGKRHRESSKTTSKLVAKAFLAMREGEIVEGKVGTVPKITLLKEKNIRKGFFEHDEFLAIRETVPGYLKGFVTFAKKNRLAGE